MTVLLRMYNYFKNVCLKFRCSAVKSVPSFRIKKKYRKCKKTSEINAPKKCNNNFVALKSVHLPYPTVWQSPPEHTV